MLTLSLRCAGGCGRSLPAPVGPWPPDTGLGASVRPSVRQAALRSPSERNFFPFSFFSCPPVPEVAADELQP